MGAHTAGPWTIEKARGRFVIRAVKSGNETVCTVQRWSPEVDAADARLIAAAPDLLAALLGFMDQPDTAESYDKAMAAAEAAIQSATEA